MTGEMNLEKLLASMSPEIMQGDYIFCSVQGEYSEFDHLNPLASYRETEGLTLLISKEAAVTNNIPFDTVFKGITLTVHSSLDAVGLTAAVAAKLTEHNISANVIAAYYHDHIFVQADKAELALIALSEFSR